MQCIALVVSLRLWIVLLAGVVLGAPLAAHAQTEGAASEASPSDDAGSRQEGIEAAPEASSAHSRPPPASVEPAALANDAAVSRIPGAHAAPAPGAMRRPGEASWGRLFGRSLLGQFVAALPGALIGAMVGLASCSNGEGWISGFTCEAGVGYGVTIGALAAAPMGAAVAIHHASSSYGAHGSFWAALGGAYAAVAIGAGLSAIVIAAADEPTWGALAGGVVAAVLTPIFGIAAYRATVSSSAAQSEQALLAPWLSLERGGASLGLMGVL